MGVEDQMRAGKVEGLTHFVVWRYINASPRTSAELCEYFNSTRERVNAVTRKLERMGFIYRERSGARTNGIHWKSNSPIPGDPLHPSSA